MTYAGYWIKQSVQRYIEQCGTVVKIPSHTRQKMTHYRRVIQKIQQEQGISLDRVRRIKEKESYEARKIKGRGIFCRLKIKNIDSPYTIDKQKKIVVLLYYNRR